MSEGIVMSRVEGRDYYVSVRRGVEYTASMNFAGWHVMSRRLALGSRNVGGCRYFASLEDLCEKVAAFRGLAQLVERKA